MDDKKLNEENRKRKAYYKYIPQDPDDETCKKMVNIIRKWMDENKEK